MNAIQFKLGFILLLVIGFTSCKKDTVNPAAPNNLPDASFTATISGAISQQLNLVMPEQGGTNGGATGGFSSTQDLISFVFLVNNATKNSGQTQISFSASASSLSNGTYTATQATYLNTTNNTSFGELVSGTVTINQVDLYLNPVGGTSIHWVSGSATLVIEDAGNPGSQISVSCQFSNINTPSA